MKITKVDKYGIISHNEGRAKIILSQRLALESGLLSARKIWEVQKTIHYPTGFKYRLALVDPLAREVVLLYDNHWPKGPHVHLRGQQRLYEFNGLEILLMDFIEESEQEEKRYYENKKDYN